MHGRWYTGGVRSNPQAGEVIADSGVLDAGDYTVAATVTTNVDMEYDVQLRNKANNGSVKAQRRRAKAAVGNDDLVVATRLPVAQGERFRVVTPNTLAGEVQASLFIQRVIG